jgi:hypothetical protein
MKLSISSLAFVVWLVLSVCVVKPSFVSAELVSPATSEEVRVNKPYDFVFLAVFDTVNELPDWVPEKTVKAEGLIRLYNSQYSRLDDSSRRVLQIRIRSDSTLQTSVFLDPDYRNVIGASEVFEAIRKKLGATAA